MEERNHTTAPNTAKPKCCCCGWGAFVVGLIVALILGWHVLPGLMLVEKKQPIAFNHVSHTQTYGIDCTQCHAIRADGTFSGVPGTAACAECHAKPLGNDPEEARFVHEYVETGREIKGEWLIYQKQPDNVFFSHAAHTPESFAQYGTYKSAAEFCSQCHLDVANASTPPVYKENRLSGYSKNTMIMWECERCHADPKNAGTRASNACFVCHK